MGPVKSLRGPALTQAPLFRSLGLCLALFLIAGLLFTWPLALHFFSAIPYGLSPTPEFAQVRLMPGDHLQTYYWFWLFSDNLWGPSALFSNPYEFNGPAGPMSTVYANFPFSLLYVLLLPLGTTGAYNGLILLSFLSSGLAMFLLAWAWTRDSLASLFAGLIFAVVPFRVSHIAGGQIFGYVIFLLPLCLYFVDRTLRSGRWLFAWAAGLCVVSLSLMEPHVTYLTALTLGVYLPFRILLFKADPLPPWPEEKEAPLWPGLGGALTGGLSISAFLWLQSLKKTGLPFWHENALVPLFLGVMAAFLLWFFLAALGSKWTTLSYSEARARAGQAFFLFLPLWLYFLSFRFEIPRLGLVLFIGCLGLFSVVLFIQGVKHRGGPLSVNRSGIIPLLVGLGLGLALASAYLIHVRATVFLPSIAGKGRTLHEVLLFSPQVGNFFSFPHEPEKYIYLGWGLLLLAVWGLVPLFQSRPNNLEQRALAGFLAFWALVLTLGPTLPFFPLYPYLYEYFPFFKYPRVPARFVMIGFVFLGLLAALALNSFRNWAGAQGWGRWRIALTLLVIFLAGREYHTGRPIGLSLLEGPNRLYGEISRRLPPDRRVLELPLWPGDSHQSSVYEYTVTRTQKPMINGYAPVVTRDYVQQVFWPLYALNHGELDGTAFQKMKELKVGLLTFHDNPLLYPEKISPFPRRLALKRLEASPGLKRIGHENDVYLFAFDEKASAPAAIPQVSSPVQSIVYSNNLPQKTGRFQRDPLASGYNNLFTEESLKQGRPAIQPGVRGGNVLFALPGEDRPGYLVSNPGRFYPSGKYRARFRVKAGPGVPQEQIGRIEMVAGDGQIMAQKTVRGKDVLPWQTWIDIPLEYELPRSAKIGFRIAFAGAAPLYYNLAVIGFADQKGGPGVIEAEDLFRPIGVVVSDPLASGREAVFGKALSRFPNFICYGPFRTLESGSYQARFFLRMNSPEGLPGDAEIAVLDLCTDAGKRILGSRKLQARDLQAAAYRPVTVDFKVPFRCEIETRVLFLQKKDLLLDRIEITSPPF